MNTNFKVICLTRLGIKSESAAPEADALTTRPRKLLSLVLVEKCHFVFFIFNVFTITGYCYCNYSNIDEEVYPTGWDYDKLHDAMKWMTDDMITKLTPDILRER